MDEVGGWRFDDSMLSHSQRNMRDHIHILETRRALLSYSSASKVCVIDKSCFLSKHIRHRRKVTTTQAWDADIVHPTWRQPREKQVSTYYIYHLLSPNHKTVRRSKNIRVYAHSLLHTLKIAHISLTSSTISLCWTWETPKVKRSLTCSSIQLNLQQISNKTCTLNSVHAPSKRTTQSSSKVLTSLLLL